ncbi:tRNA-aminoacylation cofactor ARC1-like [Asparagus officinalis]|nr:tRNA-aminoacylation cofactor ARC1-like [Asparagus officinalis]
MQDRKVCVLCNLKPATMRGIKSQAMVLAASNDDHTKVTYIAGNRGSGRTALNWESRSVIALAAAKFGDLEMGQLNFLTQIWRFGDGSVKFFVNCNYIFCKFGNACVMIGNFNAILFNMFMLFLNRLCTCLCIF